MTTDAIDTANVQADAGTFCESCGFRSADVEAGEATCCGICGAVKR